MSEIMDSRTAHAASNVLTGQSSPEDHLQLQQWADGNLERAEHLNVLYKAWNVSPRYRYHGNVIAFVTRLHEAIGYDSSTRPSDTSRPRKIRHIVTRYFPYVAASMFLLALGWGIGNRTFNGAAAEQNYIYSTGNGQRANVTLPDGSTVVLNVASRMEVPSHFGRGGRVVQLTGEAAFSVHHKSGTPFRVITGSNETTVLGTEFLVSRYHGDSVATVIVQSGKVSVDNIVVSAGERVLASDNWVTSPVAADASAFTFVTGALTMHETSLRDAIPILNRWYDVDIWISNNAIAEQRIAGTFQAGAVGDLVEMLELALDVDVVRNGRRLTINQRPG